MNLSGKSALVVGSTSGIGLAVAARMAAEGAQVAISGRKRERGDAAAKAISEAGGGRGIFVPIDAADETSVAEGVAQVVKAFGRLDILVFAAASYDAMFGAGEMRDKPVHLLSGAALDQIMKVGVYGAFWSCKYAIPEMLKAGGGAIVMLSSLNAIEGKPGSPAYSASKGALDALTRQLAIEYGKQNIRTNGVNIGFTLSDSVAALGADNPALIAAYMEAIPYVRGGKAEDIGAVVAFLVSDDAAYVNGVCMPVDGGRRVKTAAPDYSQMLGAEE